MTVLATFLAGLLALSRNILWAVGVTPEMEVVLPGTYFFVMNQNSGMLIAGGWLALALTRRLRQESGWIDSLGIAVGTVGIAASLTLRALRVISI